MKVCARKIEFCYAHRLMDHEDKCANLHGHNGTIWIQATTIFDSSKPDLDGIGRVVDFAVLKKRVGDWIEDNWDHKIILNNKDSDTIEILNKISPCVFLLPNNPTAENLANYLLWEVCPKVLKGFGIFVNKVTFYETNNCFAEEFIAEQESETISKLKQKYLS
ncbi:MAG: 6-carboxytetrahydropterin synthase [Oligoflexia bacterium]|nr:6-carboxytetrahydropterin synthase [Oligoflexia bacterium]